MKIVFLLALASGLSGLASCKSILPGGDQAQNVELEYTYINEFGVPIKVKVQSDLINLSGIREIEKQKTETNFFRVAADLRKPQVQFNPEPLVKTVYVPVPEPQVRYVVAPPLTRTIEVEVPQPEVRYVLRKDEPKDSEIKFTLEQPQVRTIYVKAQAPVPAPRTVEFQAPEPRIVYVTAPEPKAIKLDLDIKEPEDHHIFVAPSAMRTVQFKAPEHQVTHILPSHFVAATHTSKSFKATPKKSNDDDDLGSAEK